MAIVGWITSAKIEGVGGEFFRGMFWVWGVLGLLANTINFLGATGAVGVGTSTYLTVGMLYWIGGMILFGVGSLLNRNILDFKRPPAPTEE